MTAQTFAQKAIARAAGLASVECGAVVDVRPDVVLSHDNSAAIRKIWLGFDQQRVAIPERLAITLDHAVPAPTPRHALNHREIRAFVAEQGIENFFEVGRGICHQVLTEEAIVLPGNTILGADSHTPHFGWLGAFGAGIGRSEIAVLWATGELWLRVPESIEIELTGTLGPWVSTKDLALHIIGTFGSDGGLYRSVEFSGDLIPQLSHASRATLANMMAEFGAKNAYLPPDESVFARLAAVKSDRDIKSIRDGALYPDNDASYADRYLVHASSVEVQIACPHTVDNTTAVGDLDEVAVDQAFIGTCTNGRLEDIGVVHHILRGRQVASGTRLLIIPASSKVLADAIELGWVADLMAAGAVFGTPGCGPCMGNHLGVLAPGETCISSANRNFRGRMGEPESDIYLASPAVVAASALCGKITAPDQIDVAPPPSELLPTSFREAARS